MSAPLLDIRDLVVDYGGRRTRTGFRALDGVSLDVAHGETVGLVGESGSGKSTIARAVLGLVPVTSGTITFDGKDIVRSRDTTVLARDLQAVFQDPTSSINPSRTIGATLAEPMLAQGGHDRSAVSARVQVMLERVGLEPDAARRYPAQFSGGQRQRIGIARALMLSPKLIICDEVVSALDLSVQAQVLNLLQDLQRDDGLSYLFISHDLEVVRHVCDRIVVLYRGTVVESGPVGTVSDNRAHPYTEALHAAAPLPDPRQQHARRLLAARAVLAEPVDADAAGLPDSSCVFAHRCPYVHEQCRTEKPVLRTVDDAVAVACHRYPQWHQERPQDNHVLATTGPRHSEVTASGDRPQ